MKIIGECRGCEFFDTKHKFCIAGTKSRYVIENKEVFCPCRICIIKAICRIPCGDLIQYIHEYVYGHYKPLKKVGGI